MVDADELPAQQLGPELLERSRTEMNQRDVEIEAAQGGRDLHADEAPADDHGTVSILGGVTDGVGVSQRAQREHAIQAGAGNV